MPDNTGITAEKAERAAESLLSFWKKGRRSLMRLKKLRGTARTEHRMLVGASYVACALTRAGSVLECVGDWDEAMPDANFRERPFYDVG